MFKYTANNLKKLEEIFSEAGYLIRYEKGNFQSGYCILESKKVIVVSKYFLQEARINALLEILSSVDIDKSKLSEKSLELYSELKENKTANS